MGELISERMQAENCGLNAPRQIKENRAAPERGNASHRATGGVAQ
jgi:hypothetical protein